MSLLSPTLVTYIIMIAVLALLAAINAFLPQGNLGGLVPEGSMPASKPVIALVSAGSMLVIYGGLGYLGLRLAEKLGFPTFWEADVTNQQRFLIPALAGVAVGIFFVVADLGFRRLHSLGPLPHPPFPTSLVASAVAGIGEEVIFRLFFIPLWMWIVSTLLLGGRAQTEVFWAVSVFSALVFAIGHAPSVMALLGLEKLSDFPAPLLAEMFLLNGVVSMVAAYCFREYGFLAAVGVHFWTDVVWHVIWGAMA